MNHPNSGSEAAPGAPEGSDSSPDGNGQRGLFGRLFDALAVPDSSPDSGKESNGNLAASLRQVLPGIANLRRLRVEDVAIPKAEIVAVPLDVKRDELVAILRESGFSRLPVYAETLDRPVGLLLLKDLVLRQGLDLSGEDLALEEILRPLLFVPPSMPLMVLLQKMQTERTHMALVIDEYGGVDGLVTIEDILETVVGEIDDEHDIEEEEQYHLEKPGVWLVQARVQLQDIEAVTGLNLTEGVIDEDVGTLGGLVFVLLGRVPVRGEVIPHPAGLDIEVLDADPRRVKRLRLRRTGIAGPLAAKAAS
jgi:magnesium and cobalt transporter